MKQLSELVIDSDSKPKVHNSSSSGCEKAQESNYIKQLERSKKIVNVRLMKLYRLVRPR